MTKYRSILSLVLLSVYTLLVLHDFIPHTHHVYQADVQFASAVTHSHGDHHHTHEHHGEEDNDKYPKPFEKNAFGDHLIHAHGHSANDAHHHDLAYRAANKTKLVPQFNTVQYLVVDIWTLPDQLDKSNSGQFEYQTPPFDPHLSSGHGLRAPPALG